MKLLRINQVSELTGLRPSSVYKQIREGNFPRGIKITKRATAWPDAAINEWIQMVIADAEATNHDR